MGKNIIQEVVETPARLVEGTTNIVKEIPRQKPVRVAKKYWGALGPGLTTGAADDDPSGIATYSQTGALYGFAYIWLSLYTVPFMYAVQETCARIAHVTGRGLAGVIRLHYPRWILYAAVALLFGANVINIGANIGGMVAATRLLVNIPFWILAVGFTALILFLTIAYPYGRYARYLKLLTLSLLAYVVAAFLIKVDWGTVVRHTLLPGFLWGENGLFIITAVLGTTISPYLMFWGASQEIEQQRENYGRTTLAELEGTNAKEIAVMRRDVGSGMIASNVVMFFIIALTGAVLFQKGIEISSAADAAQALEPLAGPYAALLFALGIIGTGLLAIPILASSASYALSEALKLNEGLNKNIRQAYGFYGVIIIAMVIGLLINLLGFNPIKALVGAAVLNGLVTPLILTILLLVGNNQKIMGQWRNGSLTNLLIWIIMLVMYFVGAATLYGLVARL